MITELAEELKPVCELELSNYYGKVALYIVDGVAFLGLENYDGLNAIEVSDEFAIAFRKEFDETKEGE